MILFGFLGPSFNGLKHSFVAKTPKISFVPFASRRFLFLLLAIHLAVTEFGLAQPKRFPARGFAKILSGSEASERLNRFREFHALDPVGKAFHDGYLLLFRLEHYPRRGKVLVREGSICGLTLGHGLMRLEVKGAGVEKSKVFLLQNGSKSQAWVLNEGEREPHKLGFPDLLQPVAKDMGQTIFDFMMPFLFWENWKYEKSGRVIGRPAHIFDFFPPNELKEIEPSLRKVRLTLDDAYEAPLRVETFGVRGIPDKTFRLVSLKKLGEDWIAKSLDVRDARSRSRTRFLVTGAATGLDLDKALFSPAGLSRTPIVPNELFISLE